MSSELRRGPFGLTARRCFGATAGPAALATGIALLLHWMVPPQVATGVVAGAASPWLVLPLFVINTVAAVTTAVFWPTFAARRPGVDSIARLQRGPFRGNGAAIAGALVAQLALSLLCLCSLSPLLGAPPARPHLQLTMPEDASLRPPTGSLRFEVPGHFTFDELQLHPMAGRPADAIEATQIEVRADGARLTDTPLECIDSRQLLRATFAPRAIGELQLAAVAGTVPLWFPRGSITLVATDTHAAWWNAVLVALVSTLPTFVALALACLFGRVAALPTVLAVIVSLVFVQMIGEVGPFADAVRALLRGQWLPTGPVFPACLASLAVGFVAMIVAMIPSAGHRR